MYIPFIYERKKHGFWSETKLMKDIDNFPEQFSGIEAFYGNVIFANVNHVDKEGNNIFIENNSIITLSKNETKEKLEREINFFMCLIFSSGSVELLQGNINKISAYDSILNYLSSYNILNIDLKADFKKKKYIECVNKLHVLLNFCNNGFDRQFCFKIKQIIKAVTTLLIFEKKLNVSLENSPCCTYINERGRVKLDTSKALIILH